MKFIDQLKAFGEQSAGVLDAKEQAMYLRLFLIANKLGWPEWFPVSTSQLMHDLGIKKRKLAVDIKNQLVEKGFIETRNPSKTATTEFKLVELATISKKETVASYQKEQELVTKGNKTSYQREQAKEQASYQKEQTLVTNGNQASYQREQALVTRGNTSIDYKTIDYKTAAAAREDVAEVVNLFSNNIHPITGEIELQKLTSFLDDYGKDWTLAAIREAAEHGGQSVSYIFAILKNWKRHGRKTQKGEHHGRRTSSRPRESAEEKRRREQAKWDSQESGWG